MLNLSSWCLVMVEWLFLVQPWGCLRFVIVVFTDHTHLLFIYESNSTSELRMRLARRKTGLSPPVKYFYLPFEGGTSFVDHLCYLCLVFVMLSRLFITILGHLNA